MLCRIQSTSVIYNSWADELLRDDVILFLLIIIQFAKYHKSFEKEGISAKTNNVLEYKARQDEEISVYYCNMINTICLHNLCILYSKIYFNYHIRRIALASIFNLIEQHLIIKDVSDFIYVALYIPLIVYKLN